MTSVRDPVCTGGPAKYGILVPMAGFFVAYLRMEGLGDLLHGSEFVGDDYARRAKMALGRSALDFSRDQKYKNFDSLHNAFAFYEYATDRKRRSDDHGVCYSSRNPVYD